MVIVDEIVLEQPKTKLVAQILKNFKAEGRTLLLVAGDSADVVRAGSNIEKLTIADSALANVYQLVSNVVVIATKEAIKQIEEAYSL